MPKKAVVQLLVLVMLRCVSAGIEAREESGIRMKRFEEGSMAVVGDARVSNGSIQLTSGGVSSGRALFPQPVRVVDRANNRSASFKTSFTFSISSTDEQHFGDGLAFIMVAANGSLGGTGGWLGFLNSTADTPDDRLHSFAVEFDTFLNVEFMDPNDNHVGVDVNSMTSLEFADAGSHNIHLRSGQPITAWIEYDSGRQELEVSLSYNPQQKPLKRLLSLTISLCALLYDYMFIGFSAATGGDAQLHAIHSWSFTTTFSSYSAPSPSSPPPGTPADPGLGTSSSSSSINSTGTLSPKNSMSWCSGKLCSITTAKFIAISTSSAVAGALCLSALLWLLCYRREAVMSMVSRCFKAKTKKEGAGAEHVDDMEAAGWMPHKLSYWELRGATKGFSPGRVLGHGAFGSVYKGQLQWQGKQVAIAVKRAERGSKHGAEEFMSELSIIGRLRHRNLLHLRGWCRHKRELLLVYDYMPNGSLDKLLFTTSSSSSSSSPGVHLLGWEVRFKVVVGVGSALAYLHSEWEQQVVHRDVKASNILLDANMNARLADFGLARLVDHDSSPETSITAGTVGYLAPEYLHTGKASPKTDVYSFGVVTLEVCTGRRPIFEDEQQTVLLVDWVWRLHREQRIGDAADPRLGSHFEARQMVDLLHLGLLCCHPDPFQRPAMKQALHYLSSSSSSSSVPTPPRFKPTPSFASSLPPLTIHDLIVDPLND